MSNIIHKGNVSFVNHEKQYIIIEYEEKGKKKVVNGSVAEKRQQRSMDKKLIRKKHQFHIGDTVRFTVGLSDRGDRMTASNIQFLYNTALNVLIQRAQTENNFIGYLKVIDDKYFVKEIDSYLFFQVRLSPWQIKPTESELNEAVTFALENLDKVEKITAKLYNNKYIPEFHTAVKLNKTNSPVEATVYKVSPHGIYLNVVNDKIQAKLPFKEGVSVNDHLFVKFIYLSPYKVIVEET